MLKKFIQRNGHIETILPAIFRKIKFTYHRRDRLALPDGDFIDVDRHVKRNSKAVVLSHGFEGSSSSHYILGMADYLSKNGFDIISWNCRGCSGEPNRTLKFYHAGSSDDLSYVIDQYSDLYEEISLIGFSLGGNLTLKYLGEFPKMVNPKVISAATFSVPLNLSNGSDQLERGIGKRIYAPNFLQTLRKKLRERKNELLAAGVEVEKALKAKTIREFDNLITAPLHGFGTAKNYYETQSGANFIEAIDLPTLIVNSKNDPFLGRKCYPKTESFQNSLVEIQYPKYGGHVGFVEGDLNSPISSELKTLEFFEKNSKI
ncbi:MAG: YheT family hydrolase [Bdellovibrionales bacterium]